MVERLGEWFPFSSELYCRKLTLYDRMFWDAPAGPPAAGAASPFSLATCAFACAAPFGGSIAVLHAAPHPADAGGDVDCTVHVYTSAGELQARLRLPGGVGSPIDVGWTKEEALVILTDQQACVLFNDIHTGSSALSADGASSACTIRLQDATVPASSHSVGVAVVPTILSCMRPEGLFCIDANAWLRGLMHVERQAPKLQAPERLVAGLLPTALDFIPAEWNDDGDTVFYLAARPQGQRGDSTLHVFTSNHGLRTKARQRVPGRVLTMKLNHTGLCIALFTDRAELYILSSNLGSVVFSLALGSRSRGPEKMEWCGASFVLLHFNDTVAHHGYPSRTVSPMFSLLIPTLPEASVKYERFDWEPEGSGHVTTVAEVDGVRVLTERACYFLEQVPKSLVTLCRIKPLSRSAQLVAACADGGNRLPRVCRLLSTWGSSTFAGAIEDVLDAAEREFSPDQQYLLLAAASFANEVHRRYDSDAFVDIVRRLRVLHTVRSHPGCRMPLSFRQYCTLSGLEQTRALSPSEAQVLVDRLANRCCFQLAFDITGALNMKPLRLLSQWSCHKVRDNALDDHTVYAHIRDVLRRHPGSSYVESSLAAFRHGRGALAIALLNEDLSVHRKVTVFLLVGEWELAMHWAALGDDADLIHLTLAYAIASVEDRAKLFNVILGHPTVLASMLLAARLLPVWRAMLKEICAQHVDSTLALYCARSCVALSLEADKRAPNREASRQTEAGAKAAVEADAPDTKAHRSRSPHGEKGDGHTKEKLDTHLETILRPLAPPSLPDAWAALENCRKTDRNVSGGFAQATSAGAARNYPLVFSPFFNETRDDELRWLSLHFKLVELQQGLAAEHGDPRFLQCSVARTLYLCLLHDDDGNAEDLRAKYHVSARMYTHTKLRALCDAGRWTEAEKLGGDLDGRLASTPPIGYAPFVEQFALHAQVASALRFIPKLDSVAGRVAWLMQLHQPQLAIEDALREKDATLIQNIMRRTTDSDLRNYALRCLQELQ
ncbi:putative vacuolar protein sorting protein 16 [Trypanosoma conorhini]|uniref:Putative vacuolar protein sorting protein 16 n=1 Tax=Trypanosoma conorhini TaxID=83891 RepID=A0A422N0W4_9TRYP|nr:putative vacuolar protein sorting protein 16 [Trypanosoma conorhini]RNE99090.1 putative vacuolar protein sorting protein 16 [Trypanosoma conorhini]